MSEGSRVRRRRGGQDESPSQPAASLPARVGEFAGAFAKIAQRLGENVRATEAGERAADQFRRVEQGLLRTLKQRMDAADEPTGERSAQSRRRSGGDGPEVSRTFVIPLLQSPKRILEELLQRSLEQTREQAEEDLYSVLLSELVPDEARILALLSSGEPQALIHIGVGAPIGTPGRMVAENFCSVGRPAQVKLHDCVPLYVGHLRALNLVEEGPENPELEAKYQILEGVRDFRDAVAHARAGSRMSVRVVRRTLVISDLGRRLWQVCTDESAAAESAPGFNTQSLKAVR
jgi:hypothetical protein